MSSKAEQPANVLFFLPDQHRPDWLGLNPELPLRTPNLDALAARGVNFTRAVTPSPVSAPARACLASGREYDRCGVAGNGQDYPLEGPMYYRSLRDAGLSFSCQGVAGVGKFDLHKPSLDWGLDGSRLLDEWGFTEGIDNEGKLDGSNSYRRSGGPRGPYLKFLHDRGLAETYVREHAARGETRGAYVTALPDDAYCDNWLSENGLRFLRGFPRDTPWHLVVNFTGPHGPRDVTESMRARWEGVEFPPPHANSREGFSDEDHQRNRRYYAAMIENIDRQIGRFLAEVERRGETDRTLVVFSSDHGEMLGDHGRWGKGTWRWPSSRVPLIIAGPGVGGSDEGVTSDALVSLIDVTATILDYAGCPPLPAMDARSLRPVLEGETARHREFVLSGLGDWRMIADGRHKLVKEHHGLVDAGEEAPLLFDLANDPWEDTDLAAERPDEVARLSALLQAGLFRGT